MLARLKKKEDVHTLRNTDNSEKLYEFFFLNKNEKYIIVLDDEGSPEGVIYENDLKNIRGLKTVYDCITKRLVIKNRNIPLEEIERLIFSLAKEQIDVVVNVDKYGKFDGVWEKVTRDPSDLYEKYIYIKNAGYSISDWIHHYYGQDITIGIHSWSEYTELLLNELEDSEIKVSFVCQSSANQRGAYGLILEKSFADITQKQVDECDIIINTFVSLQSQVEYLYSEYRHYKKVVSLYDIIDEIYIYECNAGYMLRVANLISSKGRKVYIFDYPSLSKQKNRSERENLILKKRLSFVRMLECINNNDTSLEEIVMPALNKVRKTSGDSMVTYENFIRLYPQMSKDSIGMVKYIANSCVIMDQNTPYVNVKNGNRVTATGEKKHFDHTNKIHFFGKSWVYGHHCSDNYTIPSFVQKISNEEGLELQVYNHGVPGIREDILANYMLEWDDKCPKNEPFILIHMFNDDGNKYNQKDAIECGYVNKLSSDRPHDYGEIWVDTGHIGEDGSELLARQIVDAMLGDGKIVPGIFRNKFNTSAGRKIYKYESQDQVALWANMPEFKKYQNYIAKYKQRVGGIVMNCNPFTLGHRYLIEIASKKCDKLYIFVVEEDKSIFPFEDRLELVRKGTSDLENVTILQSGNFIISALTFPGYFNKSVDNNVSVDTSDDLSLFAKHIAPTLGINVRFAGEEPLDNITRQYNETMREVFPKHGIEFVEIPRKEMGDSVISASRVRKLLKEENFEEISKIVPYTTLEYLKQNLDNLKERLEKKNK